MQDIRIAMGSMGMPVGHLSAKHLRCRTSHFGGSLKIRSPLFAIPAGPLRALPAP